MSCTRKITLEELAKHNNKKDAWLAIDGIVYNVTAFIPKHPGGEVILDYIGQDATKTFHQIEAHEKIKLPEYLEKHVVGCLAK